MEIRTKKLTKTAQLPVMGSAGAGAFDFYADQVITKDNIVTVKTGLAMEIPEGYMLCLAPRSSISKSGWILANSFGIVDSDYRGEIMFKFIPALYELDTEEESIHGKFEEFLTYAALNPHYFPYTPNDRIGQGFLLPVIPATFRSVRKLSETDRGEGGFGSTGK